MQRLQQELDSEREALKDLKQDSSEELMRLESFIITISDMAKQISSVLEMDELLRVLLRKAVDLLGSQKCVIFRVDNESKQLIYIDCIGYDKKRIESLKLQADDNSGLVGYSAQTGLAVSRKSIYEDYTKKYILDNDKIEASFCQPVVHHGNTLAVICVGEANKELTHNQILRLLSTLANFGTVALANTILVDRIREQSIRDSLTWLYNHQYFQNRLDILLEQAKREKEPLGFIMLDIDNFKEFNDTYGHQAGDFVLKKTAEILNSELRGDDIIARYGGEEFVAILPRRNADDSYDIAERIRKIFEGTEFKFEKTPLKITVSMGVFAFDPIRQKDMDKKILIKYTDEALYAAKGKGKNKVIAHKV